jgi:predicted ArsR family transcriptional regulator
MDPDLDARIGLVAVLGEPVRRALYLYVAAETDPVSREQAAAALGIARHVAKFHLDHLVEDGLLVADYRRPPGRGGPGAGRPAKVYRRAGIDVEVSVPERRYDLAGRLLARAVADAERTARPVLESLDDVANDAGREIGAAGRGRTAGVERVVALLAAHGYSPQARRGAITLVNCPFHALAQEETELVCGMNRSFVQGMIDGVGASALDAELDPAPGRCCVRVTRHVNGSQAPDG